MRAAALSESEANIPLIYRILVSVNPTAAKSIVFDSDEKIAITASYDMGLSRLSAFFIQLPDEYRERCDKVLSFLREEKNRRMYIHLECAEIYEMDDDADDIAAKNAKLIEELSHIEDEMKKAIKRVVYDGDVFDVRELEADSLIRRKQYNTIPPTVEYSLTERGRTLIPALESVYRWGEEQMRESGKA